MQCTLRFKEKIGAGQFGIVHKAEMVTGDKKGSQLVAVKTLNKGADAQDKVKFLQEAAIMGQFRHPNVVKLHGVVTEEEPVSACIVCVYVCTSTSNFNTKTCNHVALR